MKLERILTEEKEENRLADLFKEIKSTIFPRRLTILGFLVLVAILRAGFEIPFPLLVLFLLIFWLLTSFIFIWGLKKQNTVAGANNIHFGYFIFELLILTIIIHYLGAVEWIGVIFYIFTIVYSNIFLSRKRGLLIGIAAFVLYATLVCLEYFRIISHREFFPGFNLYQDSSYVLTALAAAGGMFVLVAFTVGTFAEKFREKTGELLKPKRELEKLRKDLMNTSADIKKALRIAEEEKSKTQAIIYNFSDGLLFFDRERVLRIFNPQAEIFFEVKNKKVVGKKNPALEKFPKLKILLDFLEERPERIFREELKIEEILILEVSSVPVTEGGGEKIGNLLILRDATREKQIERMKSEFVSIAAHQLRTPLSAIKWTLRMLLDGDLGKTTLEQRDFLGKTYKANERMIALVNGLLDITRIEEGRYLYKPVLTDLENMIQLIIDSYQEQIKRRKLSLEFNKPKDKLPKVSIDVEKMRLVIQNLIDNAMRYTPAGGQVTVSLNNGKKEIEVSVKDTGIGIPKSQQQRVFTKFFRGANVIKIDTEGTGLGLFIAKNIIEAHGGKIWFESAENKGTTFYLTLPILNN